jgi:hypothetical protein
METALGDELADVGLGLVMRELGLKTAYEPKAKIVHRGSEPLSFSDAGPLARALRAERLFWRSASGDGTALSLVAHGFVAALDTLKQIASAGIVTAPLGRLLACLELGAVRRYQSRLVDIVSRLSDQSRDETATLSLAEARSRTLPTTKPLAKGRRNAA